MRTTMKVLTVALILALAANIAGAEGRIRVTREESKPRSLEVRVGKEVRWINGSGGRAHVQFGAVPLAFYIGGEGVVVRFDKPGTYDYTVHIGYQDTRPHGHRRGAIGESPCATRFWPCGAGPPARRADGRTAWSAPAIRPSGLTQSAHCQISPWREDGHRKGGTPWRRRLRRGPPKRVGS